MDIGLILPEGLSIEAAQQLLLPVLVVVLGMTAYAVFVFKFYRFVAARDMFSLDLSKNDAVRDAVLWDLIFLVWYVVRFAILMPAFAFFWFAVLTLILVFLSEDRDLSSVLLIAMATVSAIRVSAYYKEDLSRDLAKILPFAVLGVFIIDTSFFNVQSSVETLREIGAHGETIVYYLLFLVALEFVLRFIFVIYKLLFPTRAEAGVGSRSMAPQSPQLPQQQSAPEAANGAAAVNGRSRGADRTEGGDGAEREAGAGRPVV